MKVRIITLLAALAISYLPLASQTWEIGISGGVSYYVGDLNPTGHFRFPYPAASVFGKWNFHPHWSVRAGFTYMHVGASDDVGLFGYQQTRNLSFQSDIFEIHGGIEFNFFPYLPGNEDYKRWTPYLFVGLGGYYFNPYVDYHLQHAELHGLGTEGQQTPSGAYSNGGYSLFQPNIPFGLGIKFNVVDRFSIGIEYGMRLLFTDYLDDVSNRYGPNGEILMYSGVVAAELSDQSRGPWSTFSNDGYQRGIRTDNDWFGYAGITLTYNIKDPSTCPGYKIRYKWNRSKLRLKRRK